MSDSPQMEAFQTGEHVFCFDVPNVDFDHFCSSSLSHLAGGGDTSLKWGCYRRIYIRMNGQTDDVLFVPIEVGLRIVVWIEDYA